jgi:hypothetical protein
MFNFYIKRILLILQNDILKLDGLMATGEAFLAMDTSTPRAWHIPFDFFIHIRHRGDQQKGKAKQAEQWEEIGHLF